MSFELKPLPYPCDALEPEIEEEIMCIHHNGHLKTYVDNLNQVLEPLQEFRNWSLEDLIIRNKEIPSRIREVVWNNAGGVYNHNLFFSIMGKNQNNYLNNNNSNNNNNANDPWNNSMELREIEIAILNQFDSMENFKKSFIDMTKRVFGSGYTWLVVNSDGVLSLINTSNQDTVLMYPVVPLLLIDLWEHAYYLQYLNKREEYVESWLNVIDWDKVNENLQLICFNDLLRESGYGIMVNN